MAVYPTAAVERLNHYNGERYNAQTNTLGFAIGGHRINFVPALRDTASVAAYIAAYIAAASQEARDSAQAAADRAAEATVARNLAQRWASAPEDQEVGGGFGSAFHYARKAAASASAAATFDPAVYVRRDGGAAMLGRLLFAASTADRASFVIPAGSATPAGAALVDGAVWGDGANIITRLAGTTRVVRDSRPGSIPNANLADMPANTVKGRLSTAGVQTDLTFAALLAAFGTFINGSSNGYAKIPLTDTNGAIVSFYLQWGLASGTGDVQLSFPMEFPNAVFAFASTADAQNTVPNATTAYSDFVRSLTRAGMVVCKRAITGGGPNTHNLLSRWIALGY